MTTINLKKMSDEELRSWIDSMRIFRELDDVKICNQINVLAHLTPEVQACVEDAFWKETDHRAKIKGDALVAHTIEQGTAAQINGKLPFGDVPENLSEKDRNRLLSLRCARVVKLISLAAPQTIIDTAFRLVKKCELGRSIPA